MKSNHKAFIISIAVLALFGLVGYFLLIGPKSSSASENLRFVLNKEKDLKKLAGDNGMEYEKIKALYTERSAELFALQSNLASVLGFKVTDRFDAAKISQPESDFPILRNEVVGRIQESYPGFPFDAKLGFPDLIKGDLAMFIDKYIRLAICERLLQVFGEAGIDVALDFDHPDEIHVPVPEAKMTVVRKVVSVRFEGQMQTIVNALKLLSTPEKYLRIEKLALHSSRSGYSHGCDLQVSMVIFNFDDTGIAPVVVTPAEITDVPPIPSALPTPAPSVAVPPVSSGSPAPKTSRPPFGF